MAYKATASACIVLLLLLQNFQGPQEAGQGHQRNPDEHMKRIWGRMRGGPWKPWSSSEEKKKNTHTQNKCLIVVEVGLQLEGTSIF